MRLWKRASNALKDQSSLWQASLSRRTALRNPEIHKAVIRATSHHDSSASDRRKVDHVREWLRLSPSNLKPILCSLSSRLGKTRSWPVALRGLLLTHALLSSPTSSSIGRLPFDLSSFADAHTPACPFDAFVRAYYAFLDNKSAAMFLDTQCDCDLPQELLRLQGLLDLLLQIRPPPPAAFAPLVLDVMDAVVAEIYHLYGRICRGVAIVLLNIYSAGKAEASTALRIVHKATRQADDLASFFHLCQEMRVANADDFPVIDRIPEEGIQELEQIIHEMTTESDSESEFKTVITQEWERFDEDSVFPATCAQQQQQQQQQQQEPPDLITFF